MSGKIKWIKTGSKETGFLYFKKHPSRKNGVKFDRYHRAEYQFAGKRIAINFGWASDGWTELKCLEKLNFYKNNAKNGLEPVSLKQEKSLKHEANIKKEKTKEKQEKNKLSLNNFFSNIYYPKIKKDKKIDTYQREESLFRNWIDTNLGEKLFSEITKADIENIFYNIVESGKSIRTVEYALTTLKQIWREAKEGCYAPDMPIISKALRKQISGNNNARIRFLSQAEADSLLEKLREKSQDLYEKTLISLHCGLRAKEIFILTWSKVDLEHGIFNIIDSKGKDRSVHMSEQVKEVMQSKIKGNLDELVYPGRENKVSGQISQVFREVANELFNQGVTDRRNRVTFHTMRHTCASWMVMKGISLYLVQKVLGHSTIQVTERYSHLAPDKLALAAGTFNRKPEKSPADQIASLKAEIERLEKQNGNNLIQFQKRG